MHSNTFAAIALLSQQQQRLNLQLKPARGACTAQCNLWLILSSRLLSPVSTRYCLRDTKAEIAWSSQSPSSCWQSVYYSWCESRCGGSYKPWRKQDLQIKLLQSIEASVLILQRAAGCVAKEVPSPDQDWKGKQNLSLRNHTMCLGQPAVQYT